MILLFGLVLLVQLIFAWILSPLITAVNPILDLMPLFIFLCLFLGWLFSGREF